MEGKTLELPKNWQGRTRGVWEVIGLELQRRRDHQRNGSRPLKKTENQNKYTGQCKVRTKKQEVWARRNCDTGLGVGRA